MLLYIYIKSEIFGQRKKSSLSIFYIILEKKKRKKFSQRRKGLIMNSLLERLKQYHEREGVSYKNISRAIEVSTGVMYNYTSGIRDLKEPVKERLDKYLSEKGY